MDEQNHIGEQLKKARLSKGYTLDDLQQLTKIQKHYLIAIEENKLDELPGEFFVKAFIRQYAEVLEIKIDESVVFSNEEEPATIQTEAKEPILPTRSELKRSSKDTSFNYSSSSQSSLPTFLMVLLLLVVLGIIWFYFYFIRSNEAGTTDNNSVINQTEMVSSENQASESSEQNDELIEEEPAGPAEASIVRDETSDDRVLYKVTNYNLPNQVVLDIDASGNSWVQVSLDGAVVFEGTIPADSSQEIEIPENAGELAVRVGYLPSTTILFGEKEIEKPEDSNVNQTQTLYFNFE